MMTQMVPKVDKGKSIPESPLHPRFGDGCKMKSVRMNSDRRPVRRVQRGCEDEYRRFVRMLTWFLLVTLVPALLALVTTMIYPEWFYRL